MPEIASIHDVVHQDNWTLEDIELILQNDPSSVNEIVGCLTPLQRVLLNQRCSVHVVKLLLHYGANPNLNYSRFRHNPIVLALLCRDELQIIKALVEKGARADQPGFSCLSEALSRNSEAEVVKLLLSAGADLFKADYSGVSPIVYALGYFNVRAFASLLDLQKVDINVAKNQWKGSLLHSALSIDGCPVVFTKFLIDRGVTIDSVDEFGDTPLHVAVRNPTCRLGVVDLLLKRGCLVHAQNRNGKTPLKIAIEDYINLDITRLLILHSLVENPESDISDLIWEHEFEESLSGYANDCKAELRRMNSQDVGGGKTLLDFMQIYSGNRISRGGEGGFDADKLLKIIADENYPLYSSLISSKFQRSFLKDNLEECTIRTVVEDSHGLRKILLNFDCALALANHLDNKYFLNMIIAFRN